MGQDYIPEPYDTGYVVMDDRNPPSLAHAIGSRIYVKAHYAFAMLGRAKGGVDKETAAHLKLVLVSDCAEVFPGVAQLDRSDVFVGRNGYIRIQRGVNR